MITIINKTPTDVINAFRTNRPTNGITSLVLVKAEADFLIFGFRTVGEEIFVLIRDRSEVFVDTPDRIELRTI